jgi:hypothetical protein
VRYEDNAEWTISSGMNNNSAQFNLIGYSHVNDPLYAGMTQTELITSVPQLAKDMLANKGEGHFYYGHVVKDSPKRWKELADKIYAEGLR